MAKRFTQAFSDAYANAYNQCKEKKIPTLYLDELYFKRNQLPVVRQHFEFGQNLVTQEVVLLHVRYGVFDG